MGVFKWPFGKNDAVQNTKTGEKGKVIGHQSDGSQVVVRTPTGVFKWFGGNAVRLEEDQDGK